MAPMHRPAPELRPASPPPQPQPQRAAAALAAAAAAAATVAHDDEARAEAALRRQVDENEKKLRHLESLAKARAQGEASLVAQEPSRPGWGSRHKVLPAIEVPTPSGPVASAAGSDTHDLVLVSADGQTAFNPASTPYRVL